MIVGFRGGPHSGPDHLRDQLQPLSDSLDAIIMCPESVSLWQGGQEDLVKQLFQYSVDTTAALYNIDMEMIYVTGLSFGGRHTIISTMDTDAGPISPPVRGIIPFAAGTNSENVADYESNTGVPLCTCIGSNDANFYNVSSTLHQNATAAGWTTLFNEIPGVGHTMAFATFIEEMMECIDFIEAQYIVDGISENGRAEVSIYPNPAADILNIEVGQMQGAWKARLLDEKGSVASETGGGPYMNKVSMDVRELSPGIYTLEVMDKLDYALPVKVYAGQVVVE